MSNHPNRGRRGAASNPKPHELKIMREQAGHTQDEAARTLLSSLKAWQNWEYGARRMHPAFKELYLIKTGQHPDFFKKEKCS